MGEKQGSITYIVASFLFFVSALYQIINGGLYIPLSTSALFTVKRSPIYGIVILFFFGTLPAFLALAAIFNLTRGKDRGLWTVQAAAPAVAGAGGMAGGPPQGQFQGQQQYHQPGMAQVPGQQFQGYPQQQQQPGFAPQGVAGPPGWQPQQGYFYPPQQQAQPGQAYQYPAGQAPNPSPPQNQQPHVTPA